MPERKTPQNSRFKLFLFVVITAKTNHFISLHSHKKSLHVVGGTWIMAYFGNLFTKHTPCVIAHTVADVHVIAEVDASIIVPGLFSTCIYTFVQYILNFY